jgi:hypothetical protein
MDPPAARKERVQWMGGGVEDERSGRARARARAEGKRLASANDEEAQEEGDEL